MKIKVILANKQLMGFHVSFEKVSTDSSHFMTRDSETSYANNR